MLQDRTIFIAGSSRGVGAGIARVLLAEGARVTITGRQLDAVDGTCASLAAEFGDGRVLALPGDLSEAETRSRALATARKRLGPIWGLVCNIGAAAGALGWDPTADAWNGGFAANLWPSVGVAQDVLPEMLDTGGAIIFTGSIVAIDTMPSPLPYTVSKAAVHAYAKALAKEVGPRGVRVNCIAPGPIEFPGGAWEQRRANDAQMVDGYIADNIPLRRLGTPEDVGHAVAFLMSEKAAYVTGACLVVDGGHTRAF